jgi:death-on-curing protein
VKTLEWIDERDALVLHEKLVILHGGSPGLRDGALLKPALARPLQHHAYRPEVDIVELGALYTASVVSNHPFVDGNRRTGFVIGILFLELNGYRFSASEETAAQAVIDLAAGKLNEAQYAAFLRANSKPAKSK